MLLNGADYEAAADGWKCTLFRVAVFETPLPRRGGVRNAAASHWWCSKRALT
jgi:hypothetical protein